MSTALSQTSWSSDSPPAASDLDAHYQNLARRVREAISAPAETAHVIGVTSCSHGEGVSTVAANLAIRSTTVYHGPVVIIDAHLERPSQATLFGVDESPGLADILQGAATMQECLAETENPQVHVLSAGSPERRGAALDLDALRNLLSALRRQYRAVVIDLPPCQEVDGPGAAQLTDGVVLVLEAERARQQVVQNVKDGFARAGIKLLGAVFNKRRFHIPGWLYSKL